MGAPPPGRVLLVCASVIALLVTGGLGGPPPPTVAAASGEGGRRTGRLGPSGITVIHSDYAVARSDHVPRPLGRPGDPGHWAWLPERKSSRLGSSPARAGSLPAQNEPRGP
jgi:hypothetical protein